LIAVYGDRSLSVGEGDRTCVPPSVSLNGCKFCVEVARALNFHTPPPFMITRARPPVREARLLRQAAARAFTLIELLTVIAIIGVLSAIGLTVMRGAKVNSSIGLAKVELAALSQALEAYKLQYGDYPQAGSSADAVVDAPTTASAGRSQHTLFNALCGKLGPKLASITNGKSFVDLARFSLVSKDNTQMPTTSGSGTVSNAFVDPWGHTYVYYYKDKDSPTTWTAPSYVLFSYGPDGLSNDSGSVRSTGVFDTNANNTPKENLDNIYANH